MKHLMGFAIVMALWCGACNKSKPTTTGRLSGPTDLAEFIGCAQNVSSCVGSEHHLLLIANSFGNDLRIFDVEDSNFFEAPEPLFPLSIPVGELPVSLAIDPTGRYAFVVNAVSQDISLVDLAADALMEVSRVSLLSPGENLQPGETLQPEFVAVPQPGTWDTQTPLPIYVSYVSPLESGQISGHIAVLNFQYPDATVTPSIPLNLTLLQPPVDIGVDGSMPSGLALTKDGSTLFVADEGLTTIYKIDTATKTVTNSIDVGGPSRRLALTSDESKLYVIPNTSGFILNPITNVLSVGSEISVVDTNSGSLLTTIQIPDVPRSVTFVDGLTLSVDSENYSSQGTAVSQFAWVSDLDGTVYVVDAENNYPVYDSTGAPVRFVPTAPGGMAGELISNNFKSLSNSNASDDFRIYLLYEGSNALMEFFPSDPTSTNYLLYQ